MKLVLKFPFLRLKVYLMLLEQVGKKGVMFTVSFTPTEYGKARKGLLIIDTEDIQWSFEVLGSFNEYKRPIPEKSTVLKNTASYNIRHSLIMADKKNYEDSKVLGKSQNVNEYSKFSIN